MFLAGFGTTDLMIEEVRRFSYPPTQIDEHIRWDFPKIFDEIKTGLKDAADRARELGLPVFSIGIDSWGVDYGLLDDEDNLIENPVCYRDQRTQGVMQQVFARISRAEVFERTGIQFLPFNTLFQLYANADAGIPKHAERLLMIPDLVNFFLTGKAVTEYTNATTTQMLNARSANWDREMIDRLGLPSRLLCALVTAGSDLGLLRPALAEELGLEGVRVIAPATHDTGSAVAGTPLEDGWAFISSGTWSLVGLERGSPLISADVARSNFTNEGGAFHTIRFLKNVMGLWILESCRREWNEKGLDVDYESLLKEVASIAGCAAIIFPDDQRFFNPPVMLDAVTNQLLETGTTSAGPERLADQFLFGDLAFAAKTILDSLALRYASVLRRIESLTERKIEGVHIVGGGSQNEYLNQATATATGLPVRAGPVEATVIGNVVVQAIAAGRFSSLADARLYVGRQAKPRSYEPSPSPDWAEAARRYEQIERRFTVTEQLAD